MSDKSRKQFGERFFPEETIVVTVDKVIAEWRRNANLDRSQLFHKLIRKTFVILIMKHHYCIARHWRPQLQMITHSLYFLLVQLSIAGMTQY